MKDVGGFTFLCVPSFRVSPAGLLKNRTVGCSQVYEVVFAIEGQHDTKQVERRYSEFRQLSEFIDIGGLPPFPKKHIFVSSQHREERRAMLQTWLWAVLEVHCLQSALCSFLNAPFNPNLLQAGPGDLLSFEVLTRLHSEPNKKLSSLKEFDTRYFEEQPTITPARAQALLIHLAALCCEQFVCTLAAHLLTKLLCRRTNRSAGGLLEQLRALPETALQSMHLEHLSDPVAFELLAVLEAELNDGMWQQAVNLCPQAVELYRAWQSPALTTAETVKSPWSAVGCLSAQVEFRWNDGCLEVTMSAEICASGAQVVECFTQPDKRKLWDFALANVSIRPDQSYVFEIDLNGVRESWRSVLSLTQLSSSTDFSFSGEYSDCTAHITETRPLLSASSSDTEEEDSPAVTVRVEYTETMRKGLARLYLEDIEGRLATCWQKFRSVAEGDLSPTVVNATGLREVVRVKSLSSSRLHAYSLPRTTIEDVARDRLARRMFS